LEAIIFINDQNSVVARTLVNGVVVQCMEFLVRQNGGHIEHMLVDVQSIKMLTMCAVLQL